MYTGRRCTKPLLELNYQHKRPKVLDQSTLQIEFKENDRKSTTIVKGEDSKEAEPVVCNGPLLDTIVHFGQKLKTEDVIAAEVVEIAYIHASFLTRRNLHFLR